MATLDDVRAIALTLPETFEKPNGQRGGVGWRTVNGLFVWERGPSQADLATLSALGRSWPEGVVVGIRTDGEAGKEALLGSFPALFFTIPHFDGYPAVLVRLDAIDLEQLREIVTDAWLVKAPPKLAKEWLGHGGSE